MSAYYVELAVLSASWALCNLHSNPKRWVLCHSHFIDDNTEAHRLNGNLPKIMPIVSTELKGGLQPRPNDSRDHGLYRGFILPF